MDLVTHALLGATVASASAPRDGSMRRSEWIILGGLAATLPDIDFVGFLVNPLRFLADWHQGPTHSLLLLPVFALLCAALFTLYKRDVSVLGPAAVVCGLGIASHIISDSITAYGTMLLYPLSTQRYGLGITFLIDPLFTGIVFIAFIASLVARSRIPAATGVLALCILIGWQFQLQHRALDLGSASAKSQGIAFDRLAAIAQPFSPFNWKLIGSREASYAVAYVNVGGPVSVVPLAGPLAEMAGSYDTIGNIEWQQRHHFGSNEGQRGVAKGLWEDARFQAYRRFAAHPALSRHDAGPEPCVWFTDLRYDLPVLPDTFRYGFCKGKSNQSWQMYRLRYLTENARQRISP